MRVRRRVITPVVVALGLAGCSGDAMAPTMDDQADAAGETTLLSVQPAVGARNVTTQTQVTVTFDGPVSADALALMALQEGACPAPVVAGQWQLAADRRSAVFTPSMTLRPNTMYSLHVGGRLKDAIGGIVDIERHGPNLGGTWVTLDMAGGMAGMGMEMGMGSAANHAGPGWQHTNGMYGLAFSFTTGS